MYNDAKLKKTRRTLRHNQTGVEKLLWQRLRGRQLNGVRFFRQYSIGKYVVDFYSPKYRVAVELDGGQHTDDRIREYDNVRARFITSQNIRMLRFWNHEVLDLMDEVLERIGGEVNNNPS